jgi:hypothetical protein
VEYSVSARAANPTNWPIPLPYIGNCSLFHSHTLIGAKQENNKENRSEQTQIQELHEHG